MSKITEEFIESGLRNGVIVRTSNNSSSKDAETDKKLAYASVIELANLGFKASAEELEGFSAKNLQKIIENARKVVGADRNMVPVYPGFPKQVQELSTMTLLVEQILHYWTGGAFLPDYPDTVREGLPLSEIIRQNPRELVVMKASEYAQKNVETLVSRSVALSDSDKELLQGSVELASMSLSDAVKVVENSSNDENIQTFVLCVSDKLANTSTINDMVQAFVPAVKTLNGVLRVILALATTPVLNKRSFDFDKAVRHLNDRFANSLRMKTLSRPSRRVVVERISALSKGYNVDYLIAHRNLWRRVMRMVHPYDFSLDNNAQRAMDVIHKNVEYKTFNSQVEEALAAKDVETVVELLKNNQPGNLLRRMVSILRLCATVQDAQKLADAIEEVGGNARLTTLISSYNGVLSANDDHARLTKIAGMNNSLVSTEREKVDAEFQKIVVNSLTNVFVKKLSTVDAPAETVGLKDGDFNVPLVARDKATTDRVMERGEVISLAGDDDTVRLFNHWRNNQNRPGYMDTGAVVFDKDFNKLDVITWNSWAGGRDWATYSGDKNVHVGDEAVEYIDVDMPKLKKAYPSATWIALTIQSWSGFITKDVDIIVGAMLRKEPDSGEVFDPRTLSTAFKPMTESLQSVALAVNVDSGEMIWLDSSSGSAARGMSAVDDSAVGGVLYDEINRPRMKVSDLASLWATAHNVEVDENKSIDKDAVLSLLND